MSWFFFSTKQSVLRSLLRVFKETQYLYFSWLSLLPRRLNGLPAGRLSRADWQGTQVRAPGTARLRAGGISSPHSTQCVAPSPLGRRDRALSTASLTVSSI
jgi:hypothetical protein